nr:unnamed protein product [Fasciola hepatica]
MNSEDCWTRIRLVHLQSNGQQLPHPPRQTWIMLTTTKLTRKQNRIFLVAAMKNRHRQEEEAAEQEYESENDFDWEREMNPSPMHDRPRWRPWGSRRPPYPGWWGAHGF